MLVLAAVALQLMDLLGTCENDMKEGPRRCASMQIGPAIGPHLHKTRYLVRDCAPPACGLGCPRAAAFWRFPIARADDARRHAVIHTEV